MNTVVLKVSRIGNSRGILLPAAMLRKLSWAETARAMATEAEDWSDWDATTARRSA